MKNQRVKEIVDNEKESKVKVDVVITEPEEKKEPEIISNDIVIVGDTAPEEPQTRMVKVKLKKDHKCSIGGEWFIFQKEKPISVPEYVKEILSRANLLLPL